MTLTLEQQAERDALYDIGMEGIGAEEIPLCRQAILLAEPELEGPWTDYDYVVPWILGTCSPAYDERIWKTWCEREGL